MKASKLVLALGLSALAASGVAIAVGPTYVATGTYYVFYQNGVQVGYASRDCDGNLTQGGTVTDNYEMGTWFCQD